MFQLAFFSVLMCACVCLCGGLYVSVLVCVGLYVSVLVCVHLFV